MRTFWYIERMDLRQLRYFLAIYEERSVSRAAAALNIAQSAMSLHVAKLEQELSTALFIRQPRGMIPTASGERLSQHARAILRALDAARDDIQQAGREVSGDISVGMGHSAMKTIGVSFMTRIVTNYPLVNLSVSERLSFPTLLKVLRAEVDIAVIYNPPNDPQLLSTPILDEEMGCVGLPELVGDTSDPIDFDDVLTLRLVLLQQGVASRALLKDTSLLKKLESRAVLQLNSVQGIAGAVMAGLGCAVATRTIMRDELATGRLRYRPITSPTLLRTLCLCRLADRPATFLTETVSQVLHTLIEEAVRDGTWPVVLHPNP